MLLIKRAFISLYIRQGQKKSISSSIPSSISICKPCWLPGSNGHWTSFSIILISK